MKKNNQNKSSREEKNPIFASYIYNYQSFKGYNPDKVNLGDYIQSLAAQQYFPKNEKFVDRDALSSEQSNEEIKIIGNGWYYLSDDRHIPANNMDILLTAFHINNTDCGDEFPGVINYLKNYSKSRPIGCRDFGTVDFLNERHIDCYFSSCLTTTIRRRDFVSSEERIGIVFSDFDLEKLSHPKLFPIKKSFIQRKAASKITNIIKRYPGEKISFVTHACSLSIPHAERFELAKELLRTYAKAKLVITSRIHAALPCLAMGTPVILVCSYDERRFKGLSDLLNHIWVDCSGKDEVNTDSSGNIVNKNDFQKYANKLRKQCVEFASV